MKSVIIQKYLRSARSAYFTFGFRDTGFRDTGSRICLELPSFVHRCYQILLFACLAFACQGTVSGSEIDLCKEGKSTYVIVTPSSAKAEETTAATWLARFLLQVTGANFEIKSEDANDLPETKILVGNTLKAQSYGI